MPALNEKLARELNWKGSPSSLNFVLHELGFCFKKVQNNRKLLIENWDIRRKRIQYLQAVAKFREEGRPIVYMDETYIHSGHTISKAWTDDTNNGLLCKISKGSRLIIINAGYDRGFLPDCLQIFKSGTTSGDYHHEMNSVNYEKWAREKFIPNLPPNSVVVIDNAPYHNVQVNKAPNSNSRKGSKLFNFYSSAIFLIFFR